MDSNPKFYGYYTSYDQTKNFSTVVYDSLLFPPQVMYNGVTYRFVRAFQVDTPSQHKAFTEFCRKQNCETGITL